MLLKSAILASLKTHINDPLHFSQEKSQVRFSLGILGLEKKQFVWILKSINWHKN